MLYSSLIINDGRFSGLDWDILEYVLENLLEEHFSLSIYFNLDYFDKNLNLSIHLSNSFYQFMED